MKAGSGLDGDGRWTPEFPGQREPFQSGNTLALTHGAYAVVAFSSRASEIADEIRPLVPGYSSADEPAVRLLSLVLTRVEKGTAALDEVDAHAASDLAPYAVGDAAKLQRLRQDVLGWTNTARRLLSDLGMTPLSRSRLGLNLAHGESVVIQLQREQREREEGAEA
jgi:hypothetical protein